jgi:hypothetical protein
LDVRCHGQESYNFVTLALFCQLGHIQYQFWHPGSSWSYFVDWDHKLRSIAIAIDNDARTYLDRDM